MSQDTSRPLEFIPSTRSWGESGGAGHVIGMLLDRLLSARQNTSSEFGSSLD